MTQNISTNKEIAFLLREISAAYEVLGEDRFRISAYEKAAEGVEHTSTSVKDLWQQGKLADIPGVGANIAQHLDEYFSKGKVKHFDQVKKKLPEGMLILLKVPGIGPKTAFRLAKELNVKTLKDLEKAAKSGAIAELDGFGERSEAEILEGIQDLSNRQDRILLSEADSIAHEIMAKLLELPQVERVDPLGSLRRMCPTIGDIDLGVSVKCGSDQVIDVFTSMTGVDRVLASGQKKASVVLTNGFQVDLRVQDSKTYGAQLQYFTGSKHHNVALRTYALKQGLSLSEYGVRVVKTGEVNEFSDEVEFYKSLGMLWIPPELREDRGEIEAALDNHLPKLVELSDIRGDLHVHSDFKTSSPLDFGKSTVKEYLDKAISLNYEYIGFADHSPRITSRTESQIIKELSERRAHIEKQTYSIKKPRVLIGLEVDIFANGSLSLTDSLLRTLDYAIVSIHSAHRQEKNTMTERLLSALSHPKVKILAHPTGRKLQEREGYEVDWEKVYKMCVEKEILLEINAAPIRLDFPEVLVREAKKRGVRFIINTDAHAVEGLSNMRFGLSVARRAWLEKKDVVNTLSSGDLLSVL